MKEGGAGAALAFAAASLGVEMVVAGDPGNYLALFGHPKALHV